ncbi:19635_t:CDS:2, partial [Racocetra persica]
MILKSNNTINADDGYVITDSLVFNTIDGYYAIAYMVFVGSSIPNNSTYNPIDPVMSLYVNIIKDGFNQQILIFQSYDKMLKSAGILKCQAGFTSHDTQSSICFIALSFYAPKNNFPFRVTKFIKFSTSGSVIETGTIQTTRSSNFSSTPDSVIETGTVQTIRSSNLPSTSDSIIKTVSANPINSSLGIFGAGAIFMPLKFGGYIYYDNVPEQPIYICNIINSCDSFEIPENTQLRDSGVFDNNTVWLAMEIPLSQNWFISTKDAKQFIKDYGFNNPAILSTQPKQNTTLTSLSSKNNMNIKITFFTPIVLSTGNLIIYQVINESNYLLRQTYPASNCTLSQNNIQATLRLNLNRTLYQQIKNVLYQQIISSIPINSDRLYMTGSIQSDSSHTKLLVEFSVVKAMDPLNEPSVHDIINDLDDMIKNKDTSALFSYNYTKYFDSNYGFQVKGNIKVVSICTLLSCPNVEALNLLTSQIGNFKVFTASFSEKAEIWIYYSTILNIIIKDISQFIIQSKHKDKVKIDTGI